MTTPTNANQETHPAPAPPTNVYEALLYVRKQVPYIQKTGEMSDGPRFKFASIDDYLFELKPHMDAAGLVVMPVSSEIVARETVLIGQREAKWTRTIVKVQYRVVHAPTGSKSDDAVEVLGEAQDSGDKSLSKAYTMALKQCLRQIFQVETGNDPAESPAGGMSHAPANSAGKHRDFDVAHRTISQCRDRKRLADLMARVGEKDFSEDEKSKLRLAYSAAMLEINKESPGRQPADRQTGPRSTAQNSNPAVPV